MDTKAWIVRLTKKSGFFDLILHAVALHLYAARGVKGFMPRAELCRAEAHLPSEREGHRAA